MKRLFAVAVLAFMAGTVGTAVAGSIKSWSNGEVLSSSDINSNFSHIHGTMVGGHGARLVNADVASNAAIAHSKLATPALVPKAWAVVTSACAASPCVPGASAGAAATITRTAGGSYVWTWSVARADANYAVFVTANSAAGTPPYACYSTAPGTGSFNFFCYDGANPPALQDAAFSVMVMD